MPVLFTLLSPARRRPHRTVKVIEHNGIAYTQDRSGHYRSNQNKALHRVIWQGHHGPIPKDFIIRHIDGNRDNNDISNLQLMHHLHRAANEVGKLALRQV